MNRMAPHNLLVWGLLTGILVVAQCITLVAQPLVDLGNDTVACGAILLDAGNPGATYLWSTGEVSQAISVDSTNTIWVSVTDLNGTNSDTIMIEVLDAPLSPLVSSADICGQSDTFLIASGNADRYFWYDSLTGGNLIAIGDTVYLNPSDTTTLYVEARNESVLDTNSSVGLMAPGSSANGNYFSVSNDRGLEFNAGFPITIEQVSIYVNNQMPFVGRVALYQNSTLLDTQQVALNVSGRNDVFLGFEVPVGNGFRLMMESPTGGQLFIDVPVSYPLSFDGISITGGTPFSTHYNYFYDWVISPKSCSSSRSEVSINVLPAPDIELGTDTLVCGSDYLLDATFPDAAYLWSTGDITSTILLTLSDTIWVKVSLGSCEQSDTAIVDIVDTPAALSVNDIDICGPGTGVLFSNSTGDRVVWYDSLIGGRILGIGDSLILYAEDTVMVYAEAQTIGALNNVANAGFTTTGGTANGSYFIVSNARGLNFSSNKAFILNQVTIYSIESLPLEGTIALYQNSTLLASKQVSLLQSGANPVDLNFSIPAGTDYRLILEDINSEKLFIDIPVDYPLHYGPITIEGGTPFSSHYNYFYNWVVTTEYCSSPRSVATVNVKLPVNFPDSIYSCTSVLIDSEIETGQFLWNTGEITSEILVDTTGIYSLSVTDGLGCTVMDSVFVEIPTTAGLAEDGILCGNTLTTNYSNAVFNWSTGDTTPTINILTPGIYSVELLEPRGCVLRDTITVTGFDDFPVVNLGPDFAQCINATLDAGNPGLSYLWSTGDTTQTIDVPATGNYIVSVINNNGCSTNDTIAVLINPLPTALFSSTPITNFQYSFNNLSFPFSTYQWNFGDGSTSTGISPTHTYADTGTFVAQLIAINACGNDTFSQTIQVSSSNSIDPGQLGNKINIFPNPTVGEVWIDVDSGVQDDLHITLLNNLGEVLFTRKTKAGTISKLDLSNLTAGMYFVFVASPRSSVIKKLLKE